MKNFLNYLNFRVMNNKDNFTSMLDAINNQIYVHLVTSRLIIKNNFYFVSIIGRE